MDVIFSYYLNLELNNHYTRGFGYTYYIHINILTVTEICTIYQYILNCIRVLNDSSKIC